MGSTSFNLFMHAYPRMIEILQLLGSSSFLLTPSEKDFNGPLKDHSPNRGEPSLRYSNALSAPRFSDETGGPTA